MILDVSFNGQATINGEKKQFQQFNYKDVTVLVNGLVYIDNYKAGKESVQHLVSEYIKNHSIPFHILKGAYSILLRDKDDIYFFSDNSNMHCLYVHDNIFCNSCVELTKYLKEQSVALSIDDCSFFQQFIYGKVFTNTTYVREISVLPCDEYVFIQGCKAKILKKNIGDISDLQCEWLDMTEFLQHFAESIKDEKVLCALTGGYDSRMVFAVLNNVITVDTAICGNNEKEKDIQISSQVARLAHANWLYINAEKPNVTDQYLHSLFLMSDGMEMYISSSRYRWVQYVEKACELGYTIVLSGDGGVLHKSWDWIQDFPFYNKKHFDIDRFYKQRIANKIAQNTLKIAGDRILCQKGDVESQIINMLKNLTRTTNTQSYDMFYNYITGNRRFEYNLCNGKNLFYAPLQEMNQVRCSFHLPRHKRAFYMQNRNVITEANPQIASVKTNYGMTASSHKGLLLKDLYSSVKQYVYRGIRMVYRNITGKTIGGQKATTWDCEENLKQTNLAQKAFQYAKENGYIQEETAITSISEVQLGTLIYLFEWKQLIG